MEKTILTLTLLFIFGCSTNIPQPISKEQVKTNIKNAKKAKLTQIGNSMYIYVKR